MKGKNKVSSPKMAKLGSKTMRSKSSSATARRLGGSVVSQASGKSKKK